MATSGQITVQIEGLEELRDKLQSSRADVPVQRFLDRAANHLQGGARKRSAVDEGLLRNSIGVSSPNASTRSVGPSAKHGIDVEKGTPPHKVSVREIQGWARRKGLNPYAVAESIKKRGTKPQPFMGPAAQETEAYIRTTLVSVLAAEMESAFQ